MAPRPTRPEKCNNCPPPTPAQPQMILAIDSQSEGDRLWKHVLVGTGTCVSMIETYASLGMPGNPLRGLTAIRDRLNKVINRLETANEVLDSEKRGVSADKDHRDDSLGDDQHDV